MLPEDCKPVTLSRIELLTVLDPDPGQAEAKYIDLHQKLVRYFEWNRSAEPEDMAQEALKRGFTRLHEGQKITTDNPAAYFFGIARNLVREGWSLRRTEQLPQQLEDHPLFTVKPSFQTLNPSEQAVFLQQCLRGLPKDEFEMLMAYVEGNGEAWGQKAGVEPGALRLRIHRLRKRLEKLARIRASTSVPKKS